MISPNPLTVWPVDQERGRVIKELQQYASDWLWKRHLVECSRHQFKPTVTYTLIDGKRDVPHAQARMPTTLEVV